MRRAAIDDDDALRTLPELLLRRLLIGRGPDTLRIALMRAAALGLSAIQRSSPSLPTLPTLPKLPTRACDAGRPMPSGARMLTCESSRVCARSGTATSASSVGTRVCVGVGLGRYGFSSGMSCIRSSG